MIAEIREQGIDTASLIPRLQEIRELALKEEDPLLVRALRLCWQHITENDGFHLAFVEEAETQEENLSYMLELMVRSDNKYNRDELREMTNMLQQMV
jgi:hypothetical protein